MEVKKPINVFEEHSVYKVSGISFNR